MYWKEDSGDVGWYSDRIQPHYIMPEHTYSKVLLKYNIPCFIHKFCNFFFINVYIIFI